MCKILALLFSILIGSSLAAQEADLFGAIHEGLEVELIRKRELRRDPTRTNVAVLFTILAHTSELNIHRMRGATHNQVFTAPDGHKEAVFEFELDEDNNPIQGTDKLVTDCMNQGSFNFFHPYEQPAGHFLADILPWLVRGSCADDPTSRVERIEAYVKDFEQGILAALDRHAEYRLPKEVSEGGNIEALSFLRDALIAGDLEFRDLTPENIEKAEFQRALLMALENGLKELLADA